MEWILICGRTPAGRLSARVICGSTGRGISVGIVEANSARATLRALRRAHYRLLLAAADLPSATSMLLRICALLHGVRFASVRARSRLRRYGDNGQPGATSTTG